MERAKRIELSSQPWQGRVLPLNHARVNLFTFNTKIITIFSRCVQQLFFLLRFLRRSRRRRTPQQNPGNRFQIGVLLHRFANIGVLLQFF